MKTVWVYTVIYNGLLDKIGITNSEELAQYRVREYLKYFNFVKRTTPWIKAVEVWARRDLLVCVAQFPIETE
jgi:hypothetical protein